MDLKEIVCGGARTRYMSLRTETNDGFCEHGNESSRSIKGEEFLVYLRAIILCSMELAFMNEALSIPYGI
jgi:hypothetical protein